MEGKLKEGSKFSLSYYSDNFIRAMVALKINEVEFEFEFDDYDYDYVLFIFVLILICYDI